MLMQRPQPVIYYFSLKLIELVVFGRACFVWLSTECKKLQCNVNTFATFDCNLCPAKDPSSGKWGSLAQILNCHKTFTKGSYWWRMIMAAIMGQERKSPNQPQNFQAAPMAVHPGLGEQLMRLRKVEGNILQDAREQEVRVGNRRKLAFPFIAHTNSRLDIITSLLIWQFRERWVVVTMPWKYQDLIMECKEKG